MKREQLLFVPLVGKTSACRQKEGLKLIKDLPLLPRLTAVLPPQGWEMSRGFTLIEILVVVLIIGILAAVALPQYQKAVLKSRGVEMVQIIDTLRKGVDIWLLQNGGFPEEETILLSEQSSLLDVETPLQSGKYGRYVEGSDIVCNARQCDWQLFNTTAPYTPQVEVTRTSSGWSIVCDADPNEKGYMEYCNMLQSLLPEVAFVEYD